MTLPDTERTFFYHALAQLVPTDRPAFTERVAELLRTLPDPGPGDVNRALRVRADRAMGAAAGRRAAGGATRIVIRRASTRPRSAPGRGRCRADAKYGHRMDTSRQRLSELRFILLNH